MTKQENLPEPELIPEKKVGLSPEELAEAKAKMDELEYRDGKFVKKGSAEGRVLKENSAKDKTQNNKDARELAEARENLGLEKELTKEQREILETVDKRGRLATYTCITADVKKERRVNSTGFQKIIDQKDKGAQANTNLQGIENSDNPFKVPQLFDFLGKETDINIAITIESLDKKVPVYHEIVEERTSGIIFKKTVKEKIKKRIGEKTEVVPISQFNGDSQDKERAYRIVYFVTGTDPLSKYADSKKTFVDPTTHRSGGLFISSMILPESIAKKAFTQIEENPDFAKKMLETLDPKLMENMLHPQDEYLRKDMDRKSYMPEGVTKALVIPEGKAFEAFERDDRKIARKIKPEFIKSIK